MLLSAIIFIIRLSRFSNIRTFCLSFFLPLFRSFPFFGFHILLSLLSIWYSTISRTFLFFHFPPHEHSSLPFLHLSHSTPIGPQNGTIQVHLLVNEGGRLYQHNWTFSFHFLPTSHAILPYIWPSFISNFFHFILSPSIICLKEGIFILSLRSPLSLFLFHSLSPPSSSPSTLPLPRYFCFWLSYLPPPYMADRPLTPLL